MKSRLKRSFLFTLSLSLLASHLAGARDIFFVGTAVSNVTLDFGAKNCTTSGAGPITYTCTLPNLKCRVMVANINPSVGGPSQSVQVTLDYAQLRPSGGTAFDISSGNPYFNGASDLTYTSTIASSSDNNAQVGAWSGDANAATNLAAASTSAAVTLAQNKMLIYERHLTFTYTSSSPAGSPINSFPTYHPHMKMYGVCSGRITVTDTSATAPGFVVASGSLDYYSSSYQNPIINYGGFVHTPSTDNAMTIATTADGIATSAQSFNQVSESAVYTYGWGKCEFSANSTGACTVTPRVNNLGTQAGVQNFSSTHPLEVKNVPIIINGGAPF